MPCPKGCTKTVNYPFSEVGHSVGASNLIRLMHIGQDVPDEYDFDIILEIQYYFNFIEIMFF